MTLLSSFNIHDSVLGTGHLRGCVRKFRVLPQKYLKSSLWASWGQNVSLFILVFSVHITVFGLNDWMEKDLVNLIRSMNVWRRFWCMCMLLWTSHWETYPRTGVLCGYPAPQEVVFLWLGVTWRHARQLFPPSPLSAENSCRFRWSPAGCFRFPLPVQYCPRNFLQSPTHGSELSVWSSGWNQTPVSADRWLNSWVSLMCVGS